MSIQALQAEWNHLYRSHLPSLARAKDTAQSKWPVVLDHCFARIVLDNVVGGDRPWNQVIKAPAYKNMTAEQLEAAIKLGNGIAEGTEDLIALDERSLMLRGKGSKVARRVSKGERKTDEDVTSSEEVRGEKILEAGTKRKIPSDAVASPSKKHKQTSTNGRVSSYFLPSPHPSAEPAASNSSTPTSPITDTTLPSSSDPHPPTARPLRNPLSDKTYPSLPPLDLIKTSTSLTPFRKTVLALLCQVPTGRYTTYAALSEHITATSHKTCARAVGSAMRNNPFAPIVPCHRVLATGGRIGGFGGEWEGREKGKGKGNVKTKGEEKGEMGGKDGDDEEGKGEGGKVEMKRRMLREEGVRFTGDGKVVGEVFRGFK
ncbi:F-box protein pof12 [Sphaceloma murrayae]|uniref:Methylated-DNA--protein-cysteine methyltransferase n=1 Tax=Sphaceloma murrayae TaxID=2082308 RepID=A0A2K1QK96_9PEZI|nr:F-box protein pof12 [Sphaceloma murrayae]